MKLVYMGTPDFAVPPLERIVSAGHEIVGVFTQPDKPVGRKQVLTPPDVKVCAERLGLKVYQPESLRDEAAGELIASLAPEIIVVAAYGKILPKAILDVPPYGCVNIHASLLPKYRGAAPIQRAVIDGEDVTGVTVMQMAEGLDTGDVLLQQAIPIGITDTALSMFDKLSALGAEMILTALDKIAQGDVHPVKQDDALSTYAAMLSKADSVIDWTQKADAVHNRIRGLYSWPIAQTSYHGKKLKVFRSMPSANSGKPGEVVTLHPLTIACGEGSVEIYELQLEGKKRMSADDFLIGHPLALGTVLGG